MTLMLDRSGRPASCLTATLHHLAIGTRDVIALGDFYRRALGYRIEVQGERRLARARNRRLMFVPGEANSLAGVGYAVPDVAELERLRARLAAAEWPCENGQTTFFKDAVTLHDPDGSQFSFGVPHPEASADMPQQLEARLQHVVVASRDPDRIVAFFTDVLGFTVSDTVVDEEHMVRTVFLRCSHEHHSFAVFKATEDRLDHHCYETTDWNMIRDWADYLARERITLQWGPGRHGPGNNLFVFVHDPDGNWVELSAELEIVAHDRPVGQWLHEERTLNSWGKGKLRS